MRIVRGSAALFCAGLIGMLVGCGADPRMASAPRELAKKAEMKAVGDHAFRPMQEPDASTENYAHRTDSPFLNAKATPLSTFSIDVDTASYANVRRFLAQERRLPPKDAVRVEELVNYFTYADAPPRGEHPIAIRAEVGPCPWNAEHRLVRIGLRSTAVSAEEALPRNFVFLVDTSGSMSSADRLPLLQQGLELLVDTLRPQDRVALVAYAGSAGLVLPSVSGDRKSDIRAAIRRLSAGGSTNGGDGIVLAYRVAREHFIPGGVNRVILGTDGDFNVGVSSDGELVRLIEENRKSGVLLSILGFGRGNLKDSRMESLAHHGNGHYAYIDTLDEARRLFVEQGGALQLAAQDVRLQVEFNPARVAGYRLVGYENRMMRDHEFADDTKDSGDLGAGHAVTALYEIVPHAADTKLPNAEPLRYQTTPDAPAEAPKANPPAESLFVKVRYKRPGAATSVLLETPVFDRGLALAQTSDDFRFASSVAEFAMLLRDSEHKGRASYANVLERARGSVGPDLDRRRAEFVALVETARQIAGRP